MNEITKELLEALKIATLQNQLDMLMTGEELRKCESAIAKAEAFLAAPQPADDGWIPWEGGERPVDTIVEVKLRNGGTLMNFACIYDWRHMNDPVDIVAYRVVRQSEETWG